MTAYITWCPGSLRVSDAITAERNIAKVLRTLENKEHFNVYMNKIESVGMC